MKWRRTTGILLLLETIILALLLSVQIPFTGTNEFPVNNPITVVSNGEPYILNITLAPTNKNAYHAEVTLTPYYMMDFWAVNSSDLLRLIILVSLGGFMRSDYPNSGNFSQIHAYAKGINVTGTASFDLTDTTYDGVYCLVFLNFFDQSQTATVNIQERYIESLHTLLEPGPPSYAATLLTLTAGIFLVATSRKRSHRRIRKT